MADRPRLLKNVEATSPIPYPYQTHKRPPARSRSPWSPTPSGTTDGWRSTRTVSPATTGPPPDHTSFAQCPWIQAAGATTLRQIAAELNALEIHAARGGEWSAVQVLRILDAHHKGRMTTATVCLSWPP
jgi:hypothetical protein